MAGAQRRGTIRKLKSEAGFGFIRPEGGTGLPDNPDYFFHKSGVAVESATFDQLLEGMEITFEVEPSPKGPRAKNVRLAV